MACNLPINFTYPETHNDFICSKGIMNTPSSLYNDDFYKNPSDQCYERSTKNIEHMRNLKCKHQNIVKCGNAPSCVRTKSYNFPIENQNTYFSEERIKSIGSCYNNKMSSNPSKHCYGRSKGLMSIQNNNVGIERFIDFNNSKQNLVYRTQSYDMPVENQNVYARNGIIASIGSHYNQDFFNCREGFNSSSGFDGIDKPLKKHSVINDNDHCGWSGQTKKSCGWTNHKHSCYNTPRHTFDDNGITCTTGLEKQNKTCGMLTQNLKNDCVYSQNKKEHFGNVDDSCYVRSQGLASAVDQFNHTFVDEYETNSMRYFDIVDDMSLKKKKF